MVDNERPDQWEKAVSVVTGKKRGRSVKFSDTKFIGDEVPRPSVVQLLYDMNGKYTDNEMVACAKMEVTDGKDRYYVKRSTQGFDKGQLYDPYGVYQRPGDLIKETHITGRFKYEYREVVKSAFEDYYEYLKTRNTSYLKRAESKVCNG